MVVVDAFRGKAAGQGLLREAGLPRYRIRADIDDRLDAFVLQPENELFERYPLIANGVDRFHSESIFLSWCRRCGFFWSPGICGWSRR